MTGPPRIAVLGFSIECNRFAPVATEADFQTRTLIRGPDLIAEARSLAPRMLGELPGFLHAMDALGEWEPDAPASAASTVSTERTRPSSG